MTKEELSRANNLSNFIEAYKVAIERYCKGIEVNENRLGCAIIDINKYAPNSCIHTCNPQYYTTLEQLDFFYNDSSCKQELYGTVYCIDKETKQPVWLTRWCDDVGSGWVVNRIPEFYTQQLSKV